SFGAERCLPLRRRRHRRDWLSASRLRQVPQRLQALELLRRDRHLNAVTPFALDEGDVAAHPFHLEAALAVRGNGPRLEVVQAQLDLAETHVEEEVAQRYPHGVRPVALSPVRLDADADEEPAGPDALIEP